MKLLALDLSSNVGCAILEETKPPTPPKFHTIKLLGDHAEKHGQFYDWLVGCYSTHAFDGIAWERPKMIAKRDNVAKLELLIGLVGICYALAGCHKLKWTEVSVEEAKIALTNKKDAEKVEMIKAATNMGWVVEDDHQADAGAVGLVAYDRLWP